MVKSNKYVNFKAIGLSLIFLFNPNINIIDFFPDFIGYILLCLALVKVADLSDALTDALDAFKKLILIDAAKILAIFWTFGISVSTERNSSILLWAFVFGILELVFVIPAFLKLFNGLSELGYLYENDTVISSKRAYSKNKTDKMKTLTVLFVGFKAVMSFLPELLNLTSPEQHGGNTVQNLYQFVGTVRLLAFVPVFIFGIVWMCRILSYFARINKDKKFSDAINEAYAERVLPREGIFIIRNVTSALLVFAVACVLCFDFRVENINILPDFVSAILFMVFFVLLGKRTKINKSAGLALSVAYFVTALLSSYFEFKFFEEYYYSAVYRDLDALKAYRLMTTFSVANAVTFALVFAFALVMLKKLVLEHCGHLAIHDNIQSSISMDKSIKAELNKNLILCAVALIVYLATDICYILLVKEVGFILLVNVVGAIIFVASVIKTYFDISAAVRSKYILA